MNFEILQKSIPEECLRAYLSKGLRYDSRAFTDSRRFSFTEGVLPSYEYSAIGSLGLNKIILVLKRTKCENKDNSKIKFSIENFDTEEPQIKLKNFVEKVIKQNMIIKNFEYTYEIFITVQSSDGNLFEVIGNSLMNFFGKEKNETGLAMKKSYKAKTLCFIRGNLLIDPNLEENLQADFLCIIVKYNNGKFFIFKIGGNTVEFKALKEAINQI